MRKKWFFAVMLTLSTIVSCQKETEQAPEATKDSGKIIFTATLDDTKAYIDGNSPIWDTNDQIYIRPFSTDPSMTYSPISSGYIAGATLSTYPDKLSDKLSTGGSGSAVFTFTLSSSEPANKITDADFYFAYYDDQRPVAIAYDKTTINSDNDKAHITLSTCGWSDDGITIIRPQTYKRVQARVAFSRNNNLAFKNVYHLIKFTPNCAGASYAILSSLDGSNISYSQTIVTFNSADGSIASIRPGGVAKSSYYLDIENYYEGIGSSDYYFALSPGITISGGFKIELKNASNETLQTFTYPNTLTTVRNKITTISNFDDRVEEAQKAVLLNGEQFNIALKTLAGDSNPTKYTYNTSITSIVADTRSSVTTGSLVSASTSAVPVYANFSGGVVTLSTPSNKIYFPADASNSFSDLKGLKTINADKLVTADVTNATQMFYYCEELVTLNMTFNANNILNTQDMFRSCKKLKSVDLSGLAGNLQTVSYMFDYCQALTEIRFSEAFNTAAVVGYTRMFGYCSKLNQLYIKGFHLTKSVIGGSTTPIYDLFKDVLKDVPSTCTIHYTPHDETTEYDVRYYLPYVSSGTVMGNFYWTPDN